MWDNNPICTHITHISIAHIMFSAGNFPLASSSSPLSRPSTFWFNSNNSSSFAKFYVQMKRFSRSLFGTSLRRRNSSKWNGGEGSDKKAGVINWGETEYKG